MTDKSADWDKDADKNLQDKDTFVHQEAYSDTENIQNEMLELISELNNLKEKFLKQGLTDGESQKILKFIEKIRQEIIKLEE
jgi:hypothetical protein